MNTDIIIARLVLLLLATAGYLLIAALITKFAPVKLNQMAIGMSSVGEAVSSFLAGVIAVPVTIVAILLLLFTVVGWPVVIELFGIFLVLSQLAIPVVGVVVGGKLLPRSASFIQMMIGILLIQFVIALIPGIGELVWFIAFCLTAGAALRAKNALMQAGK